IEMVHHRFREGQKPLHVLPKHLQALVRFQDLQQSRKAHGAEDVSGRVAALLAGLDDLRAGHAFRERAERIKQGAVPLDEALAIAKQIASALEAAHEKGITHRDLKPGNIIIKPDGAVKVLDFGLAKMGGTPTAQSDHSPTLTIGATQAGVILGTAAYMAPEQARGKEVDKRADIWAFGVVLYEMLTGQKLFKGEDLSETLASVIKEEPRLERVPAQVQRLLRCCLEKDPKQRLQAIGDWRLLLEEGAAPVTGASQRAGGWVWAWPAVAAVVTLALAAALWAPWRAEKPVDRALVRLDVDLGSDVSLPTPTNISSVAISPDGTCLAYVSGSPLKLFIRRLDQPKATELPGTQGVTTGPFFSPDGQWIGFTVGNKLNKISVEGGAVVSLIDIPGGTAGASWGEDGGIIVSEAYGRGLLRIPAGGGPPESVATLANGEIAMALPQILSRGKAILFAIGTTLDVNQHTIEVLTLADRHRKIVARGGQSARYLATSIGGSSGLGHLVYVNKATLFAVPFDLDKLEARGTAMPVLDDVAYMSGVGTGQYDFSWAPAGHGTFVYRRAGGGASTMMTLQWVDSAGKSEALLVKPGFYQNPRLSPDGKRVALAVTEGGNQDIWVYDTQRDAMTRLTFRGGFNGYPTWSPDGQYVVFSSLGSGIVQARADGATQPQALTESKSVQRPWSFTPDGKRLAYQGGLGSSQIWTISLEDKGGRLKAGMPEQFLKSSFSDRDPSLSSDGRWLAYQSNESGKEEVYVRAFPPSSSGQGGKWQISNSGGTYPRWSGNGHDLVYRSGAQIMAASYTVKGDTFVAEKPRVWITKLGGTDWDLAPDGKRVIVVTPVESGEGPKQDHEVVFLENFFDYLRQRVPLGK
ncbi:MAG: protein kinase, partial [Acidobacteriia bacterium]|nr:protein kinase [Terriglobia bacterium]